MWNDRSDIRAAFRARTKAFALEPRVMFDAAAAVAVEGTTQRTEVAASEPVIASEPSAPAAPTAPDCAEISSSPDNPDSSDQAEPAAIEAAPSAGQPPIQSLPEPAEQEGHNSLPVAGDPAPESQPAGSTNPASADPLDSSALSDEQVLDPQSSPSPESPNTLEPPATISPASVNDDQSDQGGEEDGPAGTLPADNTPADLASPRPVPEPTSLLVIDSCVADYQNLLVDLGDTVQVVVIGNGESGLDAIDRVLNEAISPSSLQSIQIVSHGSSGSFTLGSDTVDSASLANHQAQIQGWSTYLTADADILLYGCNIAGGVEGTTLLTELAALTTADIAASDDATGGAAKGGDWHLEQHLGQIDSQSAMSGAALAAYEGLLAAPVIGGAVAGQTVNDNASISPFASVTIVDADTGENQSLMVTLDIAGKGALSNLGGGSYNPGTGQYTFSGNAAAAQTAIRGLVFTPTANRVVPTLTETTTLTISVTDATSNNVTNTITTVIATSINDAPTIGGAVAGQAVSDTANLTPFAGITIADADSSQVQTWTVTPDAAAKGALTNLAGGVYNGTNYSITGTAGEAQTAIRGLVFTPTANRIAPGSTETTTFTIATDNSGAAVSNAGTTVVSTSINDGPTALADPLTIFEDTASLSGNILTNDTDPDSGDSKIVTAFRLGATAGAGTSGSLGSALIGSYGRLTLAADGGYSYVLDNSSLAIQSLGVGQTLTESFNYTMTDGAAVASAAVITVTINGTNDAPLATAASLVVTTPVPENATNAENPGLVVSSLLKSITGTERVADVDTTDTTPGIAAYGSSTTNGMTGSWQYQLAGSATWTDFTPSVSQATIIPHDALVRFVASDNSDDSKESGAAKLQYYAWDASSGSAGGTLDTASRGGDTALSSAAMDVTFNFSARNDIPTLVPVPLILAEGATATIGVTQLPLVDPDNTTEQILYRVESLPTHGDLLKNDAPVLVGTLFSQADVVNGLIKYRHTANELAANQNDSVVFSVRDGAGGVLSGATAVSLPITIQDVNAQIAIINPTQTVAEFIDGAAAYTALNLGMNDADGNPDLMRLTIDSLPDPTVGKLQYWNGSAYVDAIVGTSLNKTELLAKPLHFLSTGLEPSITGTVTFNVSATDGHLTLTPTVAATLVNLTISPVNDPPLPITQLLPVSTADPNPTITTAFLTATDPDSAAGKRVYTLASLPDYGELRLGSVLIGVGSTFTQADLDSNNLSFHHTGGTFAADTADSFDFRVNDGDGGVSAGTLNIEIAAGSYSGGGGAGGTMTGLTAEGLFTTLTNTILTGSDSYTLTGLPGHGGLYLQGVALGVNATFSAANITAGDVVYVHNGTEPGSHGYQDQMTVTRTGGAVSGSSTLTFAITPVNDAPIILQTVGGIATNQDGGTLLEHNVGGGDANSLALSGVSNAVKLTVANLQASDVESGAGQLFYVLDQAPGTDGTLSRWNGTGWVALAQGDRFAAQDVTDGKIAYFHNPNSETRSVSITVHLVDGGVVETGDVVIGGGTVTELGQLTVNDGTNTIQIGTGQVAKSPDRTIIFTIANVNDAPVAVDTSFSVEEGYPAVAGGPDTNPLRIKVLTSAILPASDSDNLLTGSDYFITSLPNYGEIQVDTDGDGSFATTLTAADMAGEGYSFTKAQLDAGRLRYVQDGSEHTADGFSWRVNDHEGTSLPTNLTDAAAVTITILPVNDPPVVFNNAGLAVNEGSGGNVIDSSRLGSPLSPETDTDNSNQQTQFRITTGVEYGTLYLDKGGVITVLGSGAAFTLKDIQDGFLHYTHSGSEPHLHSTPFKDGFNFTISDASGMNEPSARFVIELTPINDSPSFTPSFFGTTAYVEDSSPVNIGTTVVFSDPDLANSISPALPNLNGGTLEIGYASGSPLIINDQLSVIAAGSLGLSGSSVTWGGTTIGSIDAGKDGSAGKSLLITFNSNVTSDVPLQALIRAIAFSSTDHANPVLGERNLTIAYDADGSGVGADQTASGTATVTVSQVNDRPILTDNTTAGNLHLATISEDAASFGEITVASLLAEPADNTHSQIDDVDTGAVKGIAITALSNVGLGKWQYSVDGGTWADIGAVAESSALLLATSGKLRFIPDQQNGGTATITYRAWDQTAGTAGSKVNTTTNSTQTSSFSTATDTAEIVLTDVNDAPVFDPANVLSITQVEDDIAPAGAVGTLVSTLVGGASDVDSGAVRGIALIGNASVDGSWYFTTDSGATWSAVAAATENNALLLAADAATRLYFQPNPNTNGIQANALTIRAWDRTTGSNGDRADTSGANSGGTTAFSALTDTIALTVSPVNDQPTISTDKTINSPITENSPLVISNDAVTKIVVGDIEAGRDEGTGANRGLVSVTITVPNGLSHGAVTLATTTNVSITAGANGSNSVTIKGNLAAVNAALDGLSFTPGDDTNASETVAVTVNDLGNSGSGTVAALQASQTITVNSITPVNDAPTAIVPAGVTATEDVQFSFTGSGKILTIADADARTGEVEVALSIPSGVLAMTTTGVTLVGGGSGTGAITIRGTVAAVNTALESLKYTGQLDGNSGNILNVADRTLTMVVSDLGHGVAGGTTTAETFTSTVPITISPVNDTPLLTVSSPSQTPSQNTATAITGIAVADAKDSADTGYAATTKPSLVISATHGTFTAFTAGTVSGVLSNGNRTITLVSTSSGAASLTDINDVISASNLLYTSDLNFSGTDSLALLLHDNGQGGTGDRTSAGTISLAVSGVNDSPAFVGLDGTPTFIENGAAVVLDADAGLIDPELSAYDNWGGAVLTLARTNGIAGDDTFSPSTDDQFSAKAAGSLGPLTQGSNLVVGGLTLGTVTTNSGGTLKLTFAEGTTTAQANSVLQQIAYANQNNSPPTSVTIKYVIDDGNTDSGSHPQGTGGKLTGRGSITVGLTAFNDPPVLVATSGNAAFSENAPTPTIIDPTLTLTDLDDVQMASATVSIVGNFVAGDTLAFSNTAAITGSYSALTGVLTLTGLDSKANYQAALRTVTFTTAEDDPTSNTTRPSRTVSFAVTDSNVDGALGGAATGSTSRTITITPTQDAPVVTGTAYSLAYTENQAAQILDPTVTVASDADDSQIASAEVRISAGLTSGDLLSFTNQNGISGSYNAGSGTLTLTGTTSLANYTTALRSIVFSSSSEDPTAGSAGRTVSWQVTDANSDAAGAASSTTVNSFITISPGADRPILAGVLPNPSYTENGTAVVLDGGLILSDSDDSLISGASIEITTNFSSGDRLNFTNQNGITGSYDGASGSLTLTGLASTANYQTALRSITFSSTSDDPTLDTNRTSREISWTVSDGNSDGLGAQTSTTRTTPLTIVAATDNPLITAGGSLAYTENQAAQTIDGSLAVVSDADDTQLASARVTISSGLTAGDVLAFTSAHGIGGSYDAGSGILSLTGQATLAQYQDVLRSVSYASTSNDPTGISNQRTVSWQVTDANSDAAGAGLSAVVTSTITIAAGNDAPSITPAAGAAAYTENNGPTAVDPTITISDADDLRISGGTVSITDHFLAGDILAVTDLGAISGSYDAATGVLTLSGNDTIANYQTLLQSLTYRHSTDDPTDNGTKTDRVLTYRLTDANSDGAGEAIGQANKTVAITALADKPTMSAGHTLAYTENQTAQILDPTVTVVSDADDSQIASAEVKLSAGLTSGDLLSFTNQNGISGSYDAGSGTLTLTGTTSLANYTAALRSIVFSSSSEDPTAGSAGRTVSWQVTDANSDAAGPASSTTVSSFITISPDADRPILAGPLLNPSYTENGTAIVLDGGLTLSDSDDVLISGASIQITTNFSSGDNLNFINQNGISGSYDGASGSLTLTGSASQADYQTALRSITFSSTSDDPTLDTNRTSREISWTVTDGNSDGLGAQTSTTRTTTLAVVAATDNPLMTAGGSLAYTENQAAQPIDGGVTVVSDADDTQLAGARVAISSGLTAGDVLAFTGAHGISGSYDAGSGILNLTGQATLAQYQDVLRSVTYASTSNDPTGISNQRTVSWQVTDANSDAAGAGLSAAVTSTITITAGNDLPIAVDDAFSTNANSPLSGTLIVNDSPSGDGGNSWSKATDPTKGTVVVNPDGTFVYTPTANFAGIDSFTYTITDGNGDSSTATVTVTVVDANPPVNPLPITIAVPPIADQPIVPVPSVPTPEPVKPPSLLPPAEPSTLPSLIEPNVVDRSWQSSQDLPTLGGELAAEPGIYVGGTIDSGSPHLPTSFQQASFVNRVVEQCQLEQAGSEALGFSDPQAVRYGEVTSHAIGASLGFDPNLFVQHAVRASQAEGSWLDSLVDGRTIRINLSSDQRIPTPDLSLSLLDEIDDVEPPADQTSSAEKPIPLIIVHPVPLTEGSRTTGGERFNFEPKPRPAPSFSDQLRSSGGRMAVAANRGTVVPPNRFPL